MDAIDQMQDEQGRLLQSRIDRVVAAASSAPAAPSRRSCRDCGRAIGGKLLRALPGAHRCLWCQRELEQD